MIYFQVLHKVGCAPELHAVFKNGICYAFTIGIPTTPASIVQEQVWRGVTQEMAKFHKTEVTLLFPCKHCMNGDFFLFVQEILGNILHIPRLSLPKQERPWQNTELSHSCSFTPFSLSLCPQWSRKSTTILSLLQRSVCLVWIEKWAVNNLKQSFI